MKRNPPTMVEEDVCMCKRCWEEGTEDMRHVVRHRNGIHQCCPRDYPQSELIYLPDTSPDTIAHWRAEWRHSHNDHDICRPHYLFGCTPIEQLQLTHLQKHQAGDHSSCPEEFPQYMLKMSAEGQAPGEVAEELTEETKEAWRAHWRHQHGDHSHCSAQHNYGCERGEPAAITEGQPAGFS
jgi:hypothetical protein